MFRSSRRPDDPVPPSRAPGTAGAAGSSAGRQHTIRDKVHRRLLTELNPSVRTDNFAEVERALKRIFGEVLVEENLPLSRGERAELFSQIVASVLGFGPLEPLLQDESITEVLVNGPDQVFIERKGKLERTEIRFRNNEELMRIIDRIVAPLGRRVDETSPLVDARLPDGSRVNVIIPPLSLVGPCLSIRKFSRGAYSMDHLVQLNTLTKEMGDFLRACVLARLNIVVAGGTTTGKTTMLNILSSFIPENDRIITIEDSAELQVQQEHVVRLEARPPNVEGKGEVTIRQLVINALRMRPDRIVVGEVRGGEALDMLQAMNTGHDGSLTTAHSNTPRDTLRRVETMVLMAGMDLPLRAVREQIASAFDLIVQLERLPDGSRRVTEISEVQGMEGDAIMMQDIFQYVQTEFVDGRVQGYFTGYGMIPKFMAKIDAWGMHLPPSIFAAVKDKSRR
jgi:pilus assembly protein CpaF